MYYLTIFKFIVMKRFFSFVVIFCLSVVLFSSCGGSKKDGSEGYTQKELFHSSERYDALSHLNRLNWCKAGPDGKVFLGAVKDGVDITDLRYVNAPEVVPTSTDQVVVWKHGKQFLLVKCDENVPVMSRVRVAQDWCRDNFGDEPQTLE